MALYSFWVGKTAPSFDPLPCVESWCRGGVVRCSGAVAMCSLEPSFDSGESRASVQFAEAIDSNPHEATHVCERVGSSKLFGLRRPIRSISGLLHDFPPSWPYPIYLFRYRFLGSTVHGSLSSCQESVYEHPDSPSTKTSDPAGENPRQTDIFGFVSCIQSMNMCGGSGVNLRTPRKSVKPLNKSCIL